MKDDFPYHMLDDIQYMEMKMNEEELKVRDYKIKPKEDLDGMEK